MPHKISSMPKLFVAMAALLFASTTTAQEFDKPRNDRATTIAEGLSEAVKTYGEREVAIRDELVAELDRVIVKVNSSKKMSVDKRIEKVDELEKLREELSNNGKLPEIPEMKSAITNFNRNVESARKTCLQAYMKAIKDYDEIGERDLARVVKAEKDRFEKKAQVEEPKFDGADLRFVDYCKRSLRENPDLYFCIVVNAFKDRVVRGTKREYPRLPAGKHPEDPTPFPDFGLHRFDGTISPRAVDYCEKLFVAHNTARKNRK
jgi:hypothetical protein